jgi:hypothetical protein
MSTKIGRIDRGEAPTVSHKHPDETRPYDKPVRFNLFNTNHKVPSKKYKENYDKIRWDNGGGENEQKGDA